jgi:magnesium chelatase subunit H
MSMLRRLPKLLRYLPGKAQDLRAYFLTMQYWLAGSDDNVEAMVAFLVDRYASAQTTRLAAREPVEYPETGLYHPDLAERMTTDPRRIPGPPGATGTVGLLLMRAYVLAGDTAHYDATIRALEARGLRVLPAFACGLDGRPAIDAFFRDGEAATVDALLSLTGFSLVGGPAYNDAEAAEASLAALDVPYIAAHSLEFQRLDQWAERPQGLSPVETTMMVAIPEIDGATGPTVFGGRIGSHGCAGCHRHARLRRTTA